MSRTSRCSSSTFAGRSSTSWERPRWRPRLYALSAWRETPFFTDRERAALALTEAITLVADGHVPQPLLDESATHFTPEELTRLLYAVIEINAFNRLGITVTATRMR